MAPLSTQSALEILVHTSRTIRRRNGVKPREVKRIRHAVSLLRRGYPPPDTTGAQRQTTYLDFLREVQRLSCRSGYSMIVLCAVGLGLSKIAIASEDVRLDLPSAIEESTNLDNAVLRRLANEYFSSAAEADTLHTPSQTETPEDGGQAIATHQEVQQESHKQDLQVLQSAPIISPRASSSQSIPAFDRHQETDLLGDVYELTSKDVQHIVQSGQISGNIWLTDTYGVNTTPFVTIPITNELTDRLIIHRPRVSWNKSLH